jgi:hypothetical protein
VHETSDLSFAADKELSHSVLNTSQAFFHLFPHLAMQRALLLHFFEGEYFSSVHSQRHRLFRSESGLQAFSKARSTRGGHRHAIWFCQLD